MRRSIFAVTACATLVFSVQNSYAGLLGNLEDAATGSNGAAIGRLAGGKNSALIGAGAGVAAQAGRNFFKGKNSQQKKSESDLHAKIDQLTKQKAAADAAVESAQKEYDNAVAQKDTLTSATAKAQQDQVIAKAKFDLAKKKTTAKRITRNLSNDQRLAAAQGQNSGK